jgi:Ca-activated chloride channel homolog
LRTAKISDTRTVSRRKLVSVGKYLFALLFLVALQGDARPPQSETSPSERREQETIRVSVDLVVLHATVQDRRRTLISGLDKEHFQIYEDGVLQRIESFSQEDIPVTVGLVVDNSGSMGQKLPEVVAAALAFARSSHPEDDLFVVHFNENVWFGLAEDTPFTDQEADLRVALSRIKADGMTALYDATAAALVHLKKGKWDKKVLVIISDGADNASQHTLDQVMALAEQSGVIIYTVGLFQPEDPDRNPRVLRRMARTTGGEVFLPRSLKDVVPVCEQIAHDIRNQYTLTYAPTNPKQDGAYRAIEVKARASGQGRLLVRTRAGYYASVPPPPSPAGPNLP